MYMYANICSFIDACPLSKNLNNELGLNVHHTIHAADAAHCYEQQANTFIDLVVRKMKPWVLSIQEE